MMWAALAFSLAILPGIADAAFTCTTRFNDAFCAGGAAESEIPLLRFQNPINAHAEVLTQFNFMYTVCCGGVAPITLGTNCAAPISSEIIYLSADTNAHVANPLASTFPAPRIMCLSASSGTVDCRIHDSTLFGTTCPTAEYECLGSINGTTNTHIGNCSAFDLHICCIGGGDTDPPVTTLTGTPPSVTNNNLPFYDGNSNDTQTNVADIEYRIDLGATEGWTDVNAFPAQTNTTFNFTPAAPLADGLHQIEVRAQDLAGNWETTYDSHNVTIDTSEPTSFFAITPPAITNDSTPSYTGVTSDATSNVTSIQYRVDGGGWVAVVGFTPSLNVAFAFTTAAMAQGPHTIEVRAQDLAGNWETTYDSHDVTVDWGKPQTVINAYVPDPTNVSSVTYTGNAQDVATNVTNVQYRFRYGGGAYGAWASATATDGAFDEPNEPFTFSLVLASGDGSYTFQTRANDSAGNLETAFPSDTVTLDTAEPGTVLNAYLPDPTSDDTPTYTGTATDGLTNIVAVRYRFRVGAGAPGPWIGASPSDGSFNSPNEGFTFTTAALGDGAYTFETRARDAAGNLETAFASDTLTIAVGPAITVGHAPAAPNSGTPVNITAVAIDPSNITSITVYIDNLWNTCNFASDLTTRQCYFWSGVPYGPGTTHYYNATATDGLGNVAWTATGSFTVTMAAPTGIVAPSFELNLLGAIAIVVLISLLSAWHSVKRQ